MSKRPTIDLPLDLLELVVIKSYNTFPANFGPFASSLSSSSRTTRIRSSTMSDRAALLGGWSFVASSEPLVNSAMGGAGCERVEKGESFTVRSLVENRGAIGDELLGETDFTLGNEWDVCWVLQQPSKRRGVEGHMSSSLRVESSSLGSLL